MNRNEWKDYKLRQQTDRRKQRIAELAAREAQS